MARDKRRNAVVEVVNGLNDLARKNTRDTVISELAVCIAMYLEKTKCTRRSIPCHLCQTEGKSHATLMYVAMENMAIEVLKFWATNRNPYEMSLMKYFSESVKRIKLFIAQAPTISSDKEIIVRPLDHMFRIISETVGSKLIEQEEEEEQKSDDLPQLVRRERK